MIRLDTRELQEGITLVSVEGRVIYETEREFQEMIYGLIKSGKVNIVLDMAGLSYINSSGLGLIINLLKQAQSVGGDMKLARLQPDIHNLFSITSLVQVFKIFDTVDEAVQDF